MMEMCYITRRDTVNVKASNYATASSITLLSGRENLSTDSFQDCCYTSTNTNKSENSCNATTEDLSKYDNNNHNTHHSCSTYGESTITNNEYNDCHSGINCEGRPLETRVSSTMRTLLEGLNKPGDSHNPAVPPDWLDYELFNRGRQFYRKYLFSIFFSDLLALLMLFSVNRILRPLIYTGRSDTPGRALKRYTSTIVRLITWYSGDVWDPKSKAHKDIMNVRSMHKHSANIFNAFDHYDIVQTIKVEDKGHMIPTCPFSPILRSDLNTQSKPGICLESANNPPLYISQWDMAVTQYSFLGIILVYPKRMGAWNVTERELEGLVHFWRGIGWLLGIEDKYNFCKGTLSETIALCREMEEQVIIPHLSKVNGNHEHMSQSLMQGINTLVPGLSYPAMFRFLADTLGLSIPTFISNTELKNICQYWIMRFILHVLFLIPGISNLFNEILKRALQRVMTEHPGWFPTAELDVLDNF